MKQCGSFIPLHSNETGNVHYCYGCESFHVRIRSVLSILSKPQLDAVLGNLEQMKADMEVCAEVTDQTEVQIRLARHTFLCLNYADLQQLIELIHLSRYMLHIHEIILS